jgi:hypothetical protein
MEEFFPSIANAVEQLPEGIEFDLLVARDGVEQLSSHARKGHRASYSEAARRLCQLGTAGGQDNSRALLRGWDLASEQINSVVLWLHGLQPLLLEQGSFAAAPGLALVVGRLRAGRLDFQTSPGPNRVLEKLNGLPRFKARHALEPSQTI